MKKRQQCSNWYFVAAFLLILTVQNYLYVPHTETLSYDSFKALLKAGKLTGVAITEWTVMGGLVNEGRDERLSRNWYSGIFLPAQPTISPRRPTSRAAW